MPSAALRPLPRYGICKHPAPHRRVPHNRCDFSLLKMGCEGGPGRAWGLGIGLTQPDPRLVCLELLDHPHPLPCTTQTPS